MKLNYMYMQTYHAIGTVCCASATTYSLKGGPESGATASGFPNLEVNKRHSCRIRIAWCSF